MTEAGDQTPCQGTEMVTRRNDAQQQQRDASETMPTQSQIEQAAAWLMRLREPSKRPVFRKFDRWLASDPVHEEAFRRAERMFGLVGTVAGDLAERERRREGRPFLAGPRRRPGRRWYALAASVALMLAFQAIHPNWLMDLRADAVTRSGENRQLELPDGSRVTLNTDSAIRYLYEGGVRTVELDRGEAFFDVVHRPDQPFFVDSGNAHVRVLGTRFDVRRTDAGARVFVTQGLVRLFSSSGDAVRLPAGTGGSVSGSRALVERTADVNTATAWRNGQAIYYSMTLAKVVEDLSRYRSAPVLLLDPVAGRRALSGVFDIRNPDKALKTAAETVDAEAYRLPGGILVIF